jgi:hypothetical protein
LDAGQELSVVSRPRNQIFSIAYVQKRAAKLPRFYCCIAFLGSALGSRTRCLPGMFLAVGRFELNGCFRTLICRYSGDQGMGKFAPKPPL